MIGTTNNDPDPRMRVTAEVLELGEALFDAAIEAACARAPGEKAGEDDLYPVDEMRAAADEFFAALRVLLEAANHDRA